MKFELKIEFGNPFLFLKHVYDKWVCKRKGHRMVQVVNRPGSLGMLDMLMGPQRFPTKFCKRCGHAVFSKTKFKKITKEDIAGNLDFKNPKKKLVN